MIIVGLWSESDIPSQFVPSGYSEAKNWESVEVGHLDSWQAVVGC